MGLGAYCAVMVAIRHRDQPARVERYRTRGFASGIGIPFGLAAAALGFALAR